ncbi:MAG TPA: amidase [Gammaproteobacteria bacterium]|jgi:aspartyl-tRNA(Asn)/glutamyl-tRNA(Gln) amidotransferase subunit A
MLDRGRTSRREFIAGAAAAIAASRATAQMTDLTELSIIEASALIRSRALSPVDLTLAYLQRIDDLNDSINAYITVTPGVALEQAERLTADLDAGRWRGPLHGIPIALKDNIDTAGIPTTAASELFANRVPTEDAEVYRKLKAAGAVLLGKLNLHEFAYGGSSAITHFGPVHNPWNLDYIPGGSSGGSAAAVAARMCAAALGTDTLASIRLPAAYCGVVGLKATHGLASIRGIVPISESLDHVGPLTRSVGDAAVVMAAISGFDPLDPVSIAAELPDPAQALNDSVGGLRVGLPRGFYFGALDADIERATNEAVDVIGQLAGATRDVDLPEAPDFSVLLAEAYAYHEPYLSDPANHALYDPATLERILAAGTFSTQDYFRSRRDMALARRAVRRVFEEVDVVVTPTTPVMPTLIENAELPATATGAESTVRNTAPFNLFGIPTITVPCGLSRDGLPIGLQISGPRLGELPVFALAHAYEQATDWHLQRPPAG